MLNKLLLDLVMVFLLDLSKLQVVLQKLLHKGVLLRADARSRIGEWN